MEENNILLWYRLAKQEDGCVFYIIKTLDFCFRLFTVDYYVKTDIVL